MIAGRIARRMLAAPRTGPEEAGLGPALDRLGGEVVRVRSRDGLRLSARWLDPDRADPAWSSDPHEAVVLLHGHSGSIAPDLVEYGPTLRQTAGVLGLDFRGHGESDASETTFGLREVDDVGGALAWLGERGIRRVALVGSSMGGIVALAATAVLGDGRIAGVDSDPDAPQLTAPVPHPAIVGIVAEAVPAELPTAVASRLRGPGPLRRALARRAFAVAARRLGGDPRATEPVRVLPLLEDLPILLIHGAGDTTVPAADGHRLAGVAGPGTELWTVAGAEHGQARQVAEVAWDARVTEFLRRAFTAGRDREVALGILGSPAAKSRGDPLAQPLPEEADQPA